MIDKFIFRRRKNTSPYIKEYKDWEINLNINNQKLHGWFIKIPDAQKHPVIIYYGGNAEDISWYMGYLELKDITNRSTLLMNYRGFGQSSGKPSQAGLFSDALAIYDYLVHDLHMDPEKIFLMGRSIGSSIASYVASKRQVAGLILITPFDSLINFAPKMLKFPIVKKYLEKYFNTQKYLENVKGKILMIAAGQDELVPKICLDNLLNKFKDQFIFVKIEKANHQNITNFLKFEPAIEKYIHSKAHIS